MNPSAAGPAAQAVEEITGCRVLALMSDNHLEPDMAVEVFILDRPLT